MRFNPGLQARLGLAFGAVAVLAIAANLLAERTVRVVIERVWQDPARAPVTSVRADVPPVIPAIEVAVASEPAAVNIPVHADEYAAAVEDFERAVQSRVAAADAAVQRQLESSTTTLQRRLAQLQSDLGDVRRAQRRAITQDFESLQEQANAAIQRADERRTAYQDYLATIDAVVASARQKLEGSWRILGRVIARQQMVELRDRAEELRQTAARLAEPQAFDQQLLTDIDRLEAQLTKLVPERPRRTAKAAVDTTWDEQLRSQLTAMATARDRVLDVDRDVRDAGAQRVNQLTEYLRRVAALPRTLPGKVRTPATAARAAKAAAALPVAVPEPAPASEPVAAVPVVAEVTSVHSDDAAKARRSRSLLIWISVAALLVTLAVGIFTVRGLVRQVERLLDGIRRVARGEAAAVDAGGIREFAVVAKEFNAMSVQLAAARAENINYQRDLEARVAERTAQLHFQAAHDPLTLLPNRRELNRLLGRALDAAAANGRRVGVFLIDLDNFKVVNDGMGHSFGDQVLVAMAKRLQELAPACGFAARLGGDEFTVIAADAEDVESIRTTGWALVRAFQQPLQVGGRELILSISVGASIYPDHEADADALLRAADSALFRAKALGRSQLALFTPEMFDAAEARFSTEQSLRRAVERREFELVYQPEVDSATFEMRAVEALLRWRLPDGRQACPAEFLSVAEESGLITEISDWVLNEAVAAAGRWYRDGWREVRVAINVSSRQLVDLGFVARLGELLEREGLPASAIEIELTENVLQTGAHTIKTLQSLRVLGVSTALDDFGTGYSSLASLEQLPLTRVKLDRSLIDAIDTSPRAAAIARSIISLCEGLGLEVTAEGVERLAQFDLLMRHQPMMLQGFLLARPMAETEVGAARLQMQSRVTSLLLSVQEETSLQQALPAPGEVDARLRTGYR